MDFYYRHLSPDVAKQAKRVDQLCKKVGIMTVAEQSKIVDEMYQKLNNKKN